MYEPPFTKEQAIAACAHYYQTNSEHAAKFVGDDWPLIPAEWLTEFRRVTPDSTSPIP